MKHPDKLEMNTIYNMHCLQGMKLIDKNSIDTVITDPPYGLKFMGKKWDYDVPSVKIWKECIRVLKPGGFLLSFAGTRTQHRMACNIEDAGFEIRDMICWIYGSGFPKSHNISKAIDKVKCAEREVIGQSNRGSGVQPSKINNHEKGDTGIGYMDGSGKTFDITIPATPEAQLWDGWGTALKPAMEPITIAMKPFKGTFVENALKWSVAGLNIDGARIPLNGETPKGSGNPAINTNCYGDYKTKVKSETPPQGRYPANVILDEESARLLDQQAPRTGQLASTTGDEPSATKLNQIYGDYRGYANASKPRDKLGGASRFFYCAKASKSERNIGCEDLEEQDSFHGSHLGRDLTNPKVHLGGLQSGKAKNHHPTVKPLSLMKYLCTLTKTPTGGVVLDPFLGSGTTAMACILTGRNYIGFELNEEYYKIALKRIEATEPEKSSTYQCKL